MKNSAHKASDISIWKSLLLQRNSTKFHTANQPIAGYLRELLVDLESKEAAAQPSLLKIPRLVSSVGGHDSMLFGESNPRLFYFFL